MLQWLLSDPPPGKIPFSIPTFIVFVSQCLLYFETLHTGVIHEVTQQQEDTLTS